MYGLVTTRLEKIQCTGIYQLEIELQGFSDQAISRVPFQSLMISRLPFAAVVTPPMARFHQELSKNIPKHVRSDEPTVQN